MGLYTYKEYKEKKGAVQKQSPTINEDLRKKAEIQESEKVYVLAHPDLIGYDEPRPYILELSTGNRTIEIFKGKAEVNSEEEKQVLLNKGFYFLAERN